MIHLFICGKPTREAGLFNVKGSFRWGVSVAGSLHVVAVAVAAAFTMTTAIASTETNEELCLSFKRARTLDRNFSHGRNCFTMRYYSRVSYVRGRAAGETTPETGPRCDHRDGRSWRHSLQLAPHVREAGAEPSPVCQALLHGTSASTVFGVMSRSELPWKEPKELRRLPQRVPVPNI